MAKLPCCWRCKGKCPFLDEAERAQVAPLLSGGLAQTKAYRQRHSVSSAEAMTHGYGQALLRYFELTGFRESHADALWHHRLSLLGPLYLVCGKPLRTPRAKLRAACGAAA